MALPWTGVLGSIFEDITAAGADIAGSAVLGLTYLVDPGKTASEAQDTIQQQNTNPFTGPVSSPVTVVDPKGNAIPVGAGQQVQGSKDGKWTQVKDANGKPTGTRIDAGHPSRKHPDPRAQVPHAHLPGRTNPDGTPWLPVNQ